MKHLRELESLGPEAAPGVTRVDARAVNSKECRSFYKAREPVHPKLIRGGKFRNIKWAVMIATLAIYYSLPWIRLDRGPGVPDQAFLLDFAHQRLYLFWLEIWAQQFYYVTGMLVLSGLGLFLVTALAGRVWCGYACPQTVWTDLMIVVERAWQGDRNARLKLLKAPWWSFNKLWRLAGTHLSWLLVAVATGGAAIFYFRDAPTLASEPVAWHRARAGLHLDLYLHSFHLFFRRAASRAGLHLYVSLAAHPGRDDRWRYAAHHLSQLPRRAARLPPKGRAGKAAATASTAGNAWPSAPRVSISATARSLNVSNAGFASTLATR